jgi:hypothetical protein
VVNETVAPVLVFRTAMAAPGTTLPAGSAKVPLMVPAPLFCAKAAPMKSATAKIQSPAKYNNLLSLDTGFIIVSVWPPLLNAQD